MIPGGTTDTEAWYWGSSSVCREAKEPTGQAAGAVFYLAHLTLGDWFLRASGFPQGFIPQVIFSLFPYCSQTFKSDYSFYLKTLKTYIISLEQQTI